MKCQVHNIYKVIQPLMLQKRIQQQQQSFRWRPHKNCATGFLRFFGLILRIQRLNIISFVSILLLYPLLVWLLVCLLYKFTFSAPLLWTCSAAVVRGQGIYILAHPVQALRIKSIYTHALHNITCIYTGWQYNGNYANKFNYKYAS